MEKWVIAVSGGPDSMALLDKMRLKGYECLVAHVNYNMRESSKRDQLIVERYCSKHKLILELLTLPGKKPKGNFQNYARSVRYSFFKELIQKYNANGVMVAHHLDDDLETYIMQKQKKVTGTNIGISREIVIDGIKVFRPLLSESKKSLLEYCEMHGIEFGIDESNLKPTYARNAIRIQLDSMDDGQLQALKTEMQDVRNRAIISRKHLDERLGKLGNKVSQNLFTSSDELRYWLVMNEVNIYNASRAYLNEMMKSFKKGKGMYTFDDMMVYAQYGSVHVHKVVTTHRRFSRLEFGDFGTFKLNQRGTTIESLNLNSSDFPVIVRNPLPGDKIKLRLGSKSVSRFFIDNKIPYGDRKNWIIIENRNRDIVFVVGIGCDIHHYSNNSNLFVIK